MEFESADQNFRVSWLLGLRPYRRVARCPEWAVQVPSGPQWAREFESDDPSFRASYLLGLISKPESPSEAALKALKDDVKWDVFGLRRLFGDVPDQEVARREALENAVKWDVFGLRRLLGELPPEEIEPDEDKQNDKDEAAVKREASEAAGDNAADGDGDSPVLVSREFLDFCGDLELLVDQIEEEQRDDKSDTESMDGISPEECADKSSSKMEWLRQKTIERAENKYLDRLMSLPGLEDTKAFFLRAKAMVQAASRREIDIKKVNFDVVFTGNEGTGKTAMARLYAKFLASLGIVKPTSSESGIEYFSGCDFYKTTAIDAMRWTSEACGGCIAVIDHAHLLDDDDANFWNFFVRSRDIIGNIVMIFAGRAEDGLSVQLANYAEAEHHFPVLKLPNYTKEQLRDVFRGILRVHFKNKMEVEGGFDGRYVDIMIRRLTRGVDEKKFTNIWAVKKAFLEATRRQVDRFRRARREGNYLEDYSLTKEDLLGDKPSLSPESSPAWKELQELVGLGAIKESILSVTNQVNQNYRREMRGDDPLPISANRVFLGPPGTGKTTVVKLYARLLADLGVLSKGDVIVKNPSDLIDRYIGGSERNTKEALKEAEGSVLVIDDAHTLDPGISKDRKSGDFCAAIINTLVSEISGAPGEDRCIILCGYREQMEETYANCNPGLARRFPLDDAFVFESFDEETLAKILDLKLDKEKTMATDKALEVAHDVLKLASQRPNFGNGGDVDNLVSKAVLARNRRIGGGKSEDGDFDSSPIEPHDFDHDWDRHTRAVANTRALFDGMVGYEDIIQKFESYQYMAQGMRLRGINPRPYIPFTYVFKGPPGTGKTSTARKVGQIFYDMGFLSSPEVVDVSASQLMGEYCGQTGPKTARLLTSALGKVLFIDEAYRLGTGSEFAEEAISELVDAVTKPQFARKLIIVLAGYEDDMDRLMRANQGMRSRFATELVFRPMRAEQGLEQLRRVVARVGMEIQPTTGMDAATRTALMAALGGMAANKAWASGRSVETLGDKVIAHVFKECALNGYTGKQLTVTGKDLVTIMGGPPPAAPGLKRWGQSGRMGARQVMTLRDLEGYE